MATLDRSSERQSLAFASLILLALAIVLAGAVALPPSAALLAAAALVGFAHRRLLRWDVLVGALIAVILFVPVRRFVIPSGLPFQLEPYRILISFVVIGWGLSLLGDSRVRLRRTGFEAPLFLIVVATFASVAVNGDRVIENSALVAKSLTFFASYLLFFFLVVSVVRSRATVDSLLKLLVAGGAFIAFWAIIESRTQLNIFDQIADRLPLVEPTRFAAEDPRSGRFRAVASAEHPIALSAALALLFPIAIYLTQKFSRLWWLAAALLVVGTVATVSRTGIVMFAVMALVYLKLRPHHARRFILPALLPAFLAIHFALPGTLGTLKDSFFPKGGLVAEQSSRNPWDKVGGNRLADIAPTLRQWSDRPVVGQGFGTRQVTWEGQKPPNAIILDDQWLALLVETGALGVIGWLWLFARFIRRTSYASRDPGPDGWLYAGLAASGMAYAVGMFTYDAFSFVQVTFLLYILAAFSAVLFALDEVVPARVLGRRRSAVASAQRPHPAVAKVNDYLTYTRDGRR